MNKQFILEQVIPAVDCDFLNACEIPFDFMDKLGIEDSGWCDMATGARILSQNDRILFTVENKKDELLLLLKFGNRLREVSIQS